MTGAAKSTRAITFSLDSIIDGLLYGVAWDGAMTYAFPETADGYAYGAEPSTFSPATSQQQAAALYALSSVATFTQAAIEAGDAATATIRVAQSEMPTTAHAYMPGTYAPSGDFWIGNGYDHPMAGSYAWHTILHEIGHALGLKHGHEANPWFPALPAEFDGLEHSVMTYRSYPGGAAGAYAYGWASAPQTYMMADIAALQYLYGADFTTKAGNTTYTWADGDSYVDGTRIIDAAGPVVFATIWDGGGVDTYDLSSVSGGVTIDLAPGASSAFTTRANLGNGHYAAGNVYNALLYQGDTRSLIENAIGGAGNDVIAGNQADNVLRGRGGIDSLYGLDGDDVLSGGAQKDHFHFDAGHDTVTDFTVGVDKLWIDLPGMTYSTFMATGRTVGGTVTFTIDADTSLELDGVRKAELTVDDFRF